MESYVFFEWMFQFEPACIHAYEVDYDDEAALGRLVQDTDWLDLIHRGIFWAYIDDNQDASFSQSMTLQFKVQFKHIGTPDVFYEKERKIIYTNPCLSSEFLFEEGEEILVINH